MNDNLLISEPPMLFEPSLAKELGSSDKALILQQLHYWLNRSNNLHDGYRWVYNSIKDWHKQFSWIKERTLQNYFADLEKGGYIISGNFNKAKFDKTKWYRIDYDRLEKISNRITEKQIIDEPKNDESNSRKTDNRITEKLPIDVPKNCQPIPEITHKTTQENNNIKSKSDNLDKPDYEQEFNFLWNLYPKGKKQGKQLALRSYKRWRKSHKSNTFKQAKIQLKKYLKYIKVQHVQVQFIKAAKTWFGNIDDEYDISAPPVNQSYKPIQKTIEKGTDWSKQKPEVNNSVNADQLTDFFRDFENKNGLT